MSSPQVIAERNPPIVEALLHGQFDRYRSDVDRRKSTFSPDDLMQLGNEFFPFDAAFAETLHALGKSKAHSTESFDVELVFDYAALGSCDKALEHFLKVKEASNSKHAYAIAAYCNFKHGDLTQGVALWKQANFQIAHTSIEKVLHGVFERPNTLLKHHDLLVRIKKGDQAAIEEFLNNALRWNLDWWNRKVNPEAVRIGLPFLDQKNAGEVECALEVYLLVEKNSNLSDEMRRQPVEAVLEKCRLIVGKSLLPRSSAVALYLVSTLIDADAQASNDLLKRFGRELSTRANSKAGDATALELLAGLQVKSNNRDGLVASDQLGWKRYKLPDFALSSLMVIADAALPIKLREARRDFPKDPRFMLMELRLTQNANRDNLTEIILADFQSLNSVYEDSFRNARALDGYVSRIDKLLKNVTPVSD